MEYAHVQYKVVPFLININVLIHLFANVCLNTIELPKIHVKNVMLGATFVMELLTTVRSALTAII